MAESGNVGLNLRLLLEIIVREGRRISRLAHVVAGRGKCYLTGSRHGFALVVIVIASAGPRSCALPDVADLRPIVFDRAPVVTELRRAFSLSVAADGAVAIMRAACRAGRRVVAPTAVCRVAGNGAILDLSAAFYFTVGSAIVRAGPVVSSVAEAVNS